VLFRKLVNDRTFDAQCPLIKDEHIEYKLIQQMTETDPKNRPSAKEIQRDWNEKWEKELQLERLQDEYNQKVTESMEAALV
jgi:hypothetical protein